MKEMISKIARQAREASLEMAATDGGQRNQLLLNLAHRLESHHERILAANHEDLACASENGVSGAMLDRLTLTDKRIRGMAEGVRKIASLPDPVGEEIERLHPANGLDIRKVRVPIGVIGIIYESRPNVTIDCAALCLKSGNACILRGGKEAFSTNTTLADLVRESLDECGINIRVVQLIPTTDRAALQYLLKLNRWIHCIIPRGGEGLIEYVCENSNIPVIKHYKGVCSLYLHSDADSEKALSITMNAKCQRPGVCNAIENLLVHKDLPSALLTETASRLQDAGVELRGDERIMHTLSQAGIPCQVAKEEDWSTEYLDLILSLKMVDSSQEAIAFINRYGSQHSDGIITEDESTARKFLTEVDTSTAYWNASTRFTDGFEFGLGAEVGISTDRLHARGPMGIRELCTYKYQVFGRGEIRK